MSLRGKKEQSADEVRNLLSEYNDDIQMRNEDLQRLHVSLIHIILPRLHAPKCRTFYIICFQSFVGSLFVLNASMFGDTRRC